ncbi:hypothetical protein BD324DRAFT_614704 [Kockovaella imperatae]|uniref:Ubiquilin n=1 Tax=Kockovaella imperatae TaxID=4999 RepID=A0A1Y1UQJ2_9TREE|nr:hypothetical protein BD324DRAFT_614704 [Kockovaella imperatae]ORX39716.1 hypothetical protein BD324DRAFT_614704 [Kockovaella imperatae]
MAEASSSSDVIKITVKGPSELKLSIEIDPSKTVAELKEVIAEKSDVEKDRQRLIYSGKVLKDEEQISTYKIQNGHTLHMVKGANKTQAAAAGGVTASPAAGGSTSQSQQLPRMGTGLNVAGNPVDNIENIPHGLGGFNPFANMAGLNNLNDPNAMTSMMQNPDFLREMSNMMSRPEVLDQMINSNPQLAQMGPQIRAAMQSPMVQQILRDPEALRSMMAMQAQMGGGNPMGGGGGAFGNPFGGGLGGNPFAALGGGAGARAGTEGSNTAEDPFPNLFAAGQAAQTGAGGTGAGARGGGAGAGAGGNPFGAVNYEALTRAMMGGAGAGVGAGAGAGAGTGAAAGTEGNAMGQANPFAMYQNMFGGMGAGGWGGMGGFGSPPPPADTRPPEEIYATQLGQLNGMGLWDAQKNIRALRATGGNVEAAIELIFSGSLDQ